MPKLYYLFISLLLSLSTAYAQDTAPKQIEIVYAGTLTIDNDKYPGATIFNSDDQRKVQFRHQGMDIWCDVAVLYQKTNQVKAFGDVFIQQGDSLKMNSNFVEYNGDTKIALAKENVKLRNEKMTLETQELFFDRNTQEAYYLNHGKISDEENVLTSKEGRYFVAPKKSQFSSQVNITNADFQINSLTLDYYHSTGHVYMFGPTTITGKDYIAYGEKGFYDTKTEKGYFMDMARIDYDNKRLTGDSLYFDKFRNFASATNNIIIRDTINHTLVKGHYGEIHKAQDSMFITKKALIASLVDKDSVYIHAKRIMVTGKTGARIVRAYTGARIYKTDIQGKCDSIHSSQTTGLTQLIGRPILWSGKSQMTGDHIQLLANTQTEKLDSLRVFDNAFLIEKDTLGEGYNQVKGKTLKGKFKENKLNNVNLYQNTEVIYYVYDDQNNPAGINKSKCSQIRVDFATNQQIETVIFYKDVDGGIYPEDKINKEELRFPNFNWRGDEIILSKNDIFPEEEKNIQLTPIKGIKTEEIDLIEEKLNPKIEN
ncbi:MAG: OstA-like protein [Capnocytophaga sp.]|nr:MAG: OstA-like protein [Capnocytophaga sp.]